MVDVEAYVLKGSGRDEVPKERRRGLCGCCD